MTAPLPAGWYDVSPPIHPGLAVFPGDQPFERAVAMGFDRGDHLALSAVRTTVHIGAHADAPSHYHPDGAPIDQRPLDRYLGLAQVMHIAGKPRQRLGPADLPGPVLAPRLLLATGTFPEPDRWHDDFAALGPELVDFLAESGVELVGIDTPSVDIADDKELLAHQAIFRRDLAVLEGLVLTHVPAGLYTLVALPLRLAGADASPVRAVLLPVGAMPPP